MMNRQKKDSPPRKSTGSYIKPDPEDEVVITGVAGRFPDSDNIQHLQENLFNKVDLISNDGRRWKLDHPEIPQRTGKINNVSKFDAFFFGVHFKQAHTMDPMCRMLLEHTYEALIDAGINPRQLRGTKTGVFVGACFSESEKTWFYEKLQVNGFGITGCSRAMLANRVSYWLGINGPSFTVDSACSSSLLALETAYRAIRTGLCDAAIVGGSNLCLHPYVSLQFSRLGVLSPDGRCKSFDANANGYTRSETVAVIFLQKRKDAKRIYATVVHGKTNCDGYKEQGITFPSSVMQSVLLREFYEECGIPPTVLNYMEAHGTGTFVGDPEEINAIESVFCKGRTTPLKIGSIKSNLGHSEPASGLCSIAKMIIAMETGLIPANLHYNRPREGVKALEDGRLQVVTELTPWECGYAGVNSFGFGGANAHILLKSNPKEKVNGGLPDDDLPRLAVVSGRTEEAVVSLLNFVSSRPVDVEYMKLLHDIHSEEIQGHLYRGYTICKSQVEETPIKEIQNYQGEKRQVWFVFSGMGSQWPGMGKTLMRLPVFAKAIQKCDAVLKPRGVDIIDILTNKDKKIFDNILHSFVGIAAVQIGLVDLLTSVGILPDRIIGHSVGELGCAYADGCFTAEQMILSAYSRGLASIETKVIHGSMAAIGLGYADIKDICPPDIEVACHNGPGSCTISGPADSVKAFVAKLQVDKIFAQEVACCNIPYHSRYIAPAGPKLLAYLKEVIPNPRARSEKWLSSSIPRAEWSTAAARLSSAEYHTNNLLSAVLFEETAVLIPKDAITIEIAPHGLLQAILRRSLDPSITNVPLTQRGHKDNVEIFVQALGKLYNAGLHPQVANLYPVVEYPVSRGTPMISPLIKWEHSDDWYVTSYRMQEKIESGERHIHVALADEDFEFMAGHSIDGRNLLPATGYLTLVWETLGMMRGELFTEVSVVFEDVKFLRATNIPKDATVKLTVMLQKGTGRFEVSEGYATVVTGMIRAPPNIEKEKIKPEILALFDKDDEEDEPLNAKDVYKELKLRGYNYSGLFCGIKSASITGSRGMIAWQNNWVAFMDNLLQMGILGNKVRGLFVPTAIQKLVIDTKTHLNQIRDMPSDDNKQFPVRAYKEIGAIISGGVEMRGLKANAISRRKPIGEPVLEDYKFVAHRDRAEVSLREVVRLSAHLAIENLQAIKVRTIELIDDDDKVAAEELLSPIFLETFADIPLLQGEGILAAPADRYVDEALLKRVTLTEAKKLPTDNNAVVACGVELLSKKKTASLQQFESSLRHGGFILSREPTTCKIDDEFLANTGLTVILEKRVKDELFVLLRRKVKLAQRTMVVHVTNNDFNWLKQLNDIMNAEAEKEKSGRLRLIVVGEKDFECGVLGFANCLKMESGGEIVRCVVIQDPNAPDFSLEEPLYRNQLNLDLTVNVLRSKNVWGSYRHMALKPLEEKLVYQATLNQKVRGDLSSLCWLEGSITPNIKDQLLTRVMYSAINFRDIMLTTGKLAPESIANGDGDGLPPPCLYGLEYSGIDSSGRRIMGLDSFGCFTNIFKADPYLVWEVPEDWTLEEAATVPCVYGTSYYALCVKGKMKKGEKVLIHAGTGGVGQAAINLALHAGCEVFTTVGTEEKRQFIKETFPSIDDDHIGNSRDTSFEQLILKQTNGKGVDIVLNSLAEDKLLASVRCLGSCGRFLEIGKFDLAANNPLGMQVFLKEVSFHGIMLDYVLVGGEERKREFHSMLLKGVREGSVKPLNRKVFAKSEVESAFRHMAAGKHIGKVMIKIHDDNESLFAPIAAYPDYHCSPDKSYIIIGGLGGFGLELANWLVIRGAKNIVLTSRTGIKNGYQRSRIAVWKYYGVNVLIISSQDASVARDCEFILKTANDMGPVDAIFNLAVVLKDGLCKNQNSETFEESFKAKAWSTKRLDELSRKLCPELRHFVVFSSVSCGRGNAGQTNYGMANSVMERICERRVEEGLPGLAIQWGAIGDVGLVAEKQEGDKQLVIGGTLQQRISSCLEELNGFLLQDRPIVSSMVVAEKRAAGAGADNVLDTVLNIMGIKDLKTVSLHTSLAELGMDSMMAVEIKQTLERQFEIFLTAQDIRSLNFAKLKEMSVKGTEEEKKQQALSQVGNPLSGIKLILQRVNVIQNSDICVDLQTKKEDGRGQIFIIPGIEGSASIFENLAPKIRPLATCLQLASTDVNHDSVADMAKSFLPRVLERSKGRRDFIIVGYSFGSIVAIELVRLLEANGLTGRLILIDGSPEQMKVMVHQYIPSNSNDELQCNVLLAAMDTISPTSSTKLVVELEKCSTWDERADKFVYHLPTEIEFDRKLAKLLVTWIYKRFVAILSYTPPTTRITTPIMLLKPTTATCTENYALDTITLNKVEVHYIEGNHVSMLDDVLTAAAINGEPVEDAHTFKEGIMQDGQYLTPISDETRRP